MGVIKFTVFATLLSLTLGSASYAVDEPMVISDQASYVPVQHQFSDMPAEQSSYGTVINFTDAQFATSPQVATAPMIVDSVQPTAVQPQLAPVIERVAHLPVSRPVTAALKSLAADESLSDLVRNSNGTVLIDFYADWCGPCRQQSEILADMEDTASQLDALIVKVNVDQHRDLAEQLSVKSLPTILVVKDGQLVSRQSGIADHNRIEVMLSR